MRELLAMPGPGIVIEFPAAAEGKEYARRSRGVVDRMVTWLLISGVGSCLFAIGWELSPWFFDLLQRAGLLPGGLQ
jgi:hypothetical protein